MARRRRRAAAATNPARRKAAAAASGPAINGNRPGTATKLQHAILDDGRSYRQLALLMGVPEVEFGKVARGIKPASSTFRRGIAGLLHKPVGALFSLIAAVISG
jgi:hypothetical protein